MEGTRRREAEKDLVSSLKDDDDDAQVKREHCPSIIILFLLQVSSSCIPLSAVYSCLLHRGYLSSSSAVFIIISLFR